MAQTTYLNILQEAFCKSTERVRRTSLPLEAPIVYAERFGNDFELFLAEKDEIFFLQTYPIPEIADENWKETCRHRFLVNLLQSHTHLLITNKLQNG